MYILSQSSAFSLFAASELDFNRTNLTLAKKPRKKLTCKAKKNFKIEEDILCRLELLFPQFIGDHNRMMEQWVWKQKAAEVIYI